MISMATSAVCTHTQTYTHTEGSQTFLLMRGASCPRYHVLRGNHIRVPCPTLLTHSIHKCNMNEHKYASMTHSDKLLCTLSCMYAKTLMKHTKTHTNRCILSLTIYIWDRAGVQTNNVFSTKKCCWLNLVDVTVVLVGFRNFWKSKNNLWEKNAAKS